MMEMGSSLPLLLLLPIVFHQSNRPSPTFTDFLEYLRRDSTLGVIPFEFSADSSKIGGAGG